MESPEMKQNLKVEPINSKIVPKVYHSGIALTIIVSLLFGLVGGSIGSWFVFNNPAVNSAAQSGSIIRGSYQENSDIINAVKSSSPSVVSIIVEKDISQVPGFGSNPFEGFLFPFGSTPNQNQSNEPNIQQVGAGSGFFVSSDGLILTNRHVVSDESATYSVITNDGTSYKASVLTRDPVNDMAILKVDINNAPALTLGNSEMLEIGQQVVAIGNSLGQYQNTVTSGIVSGIGRSITAGGQDGSEQLEGVIQTDAAINPGNSGGPLLNLAGQVIGINTAVDREGQSVGFAIPSNDAASALESFRKNGKITRPYIGVRYVIVTAAVAKENNLGRDYGALLIHGERIDEPAVLEGSPADKSGLQENDIILSIDGDKIDQDNTLAHYLRDHMAGDIVSLQVFRSGDEISVPVELGAQ